MKENPEFETKLMRNGMVCTCFSTSSLHTNLVPRPQPSFSSLEVQKNREMQKKCK